MIFDTESDGLWYEATKIHVMAWWENGKSQYTSDYNMMRELLAKSEWIACHNLVRHDLKLFKKILGVDYKGTVRDTLAMSWALFPSLNKHGLEDHGVRYGIPKPKVYDWHNLSVEEYGHRCVEDVKINKALYDELWKKGMLIYEDNKEEFYRYLDYLTFKMQCAADQEDNPIELDMPRVQKNIEELTSVIEEKKAELQSHMPYVTKYTKKEPPKNPYKQDGSISSHGQRWLDQGGDPNFKETLEIPRLEEPNAGSPEQVKEWLFSKGWSPCTYKYEKDKDGNERKIPQVRYPTGNSRAGELTDSVVRLAESDPSVRILEGLSVAQHRLGVFTGLLSGSTSTPDGRSVVDATIGGFTNTLRFQHKKPLVNLPKVDKPYGEEIRGSLITTKGYLFGSDMVSLESTTKRHYMMPNDPKYVAEMSQEGFDEHLDLAKHAGELTEDDYSAYTQAGDSFKESDDYKKIKKTRNKYKPANYSCVYGVGKVKLARTTGLSESEAERLITAYWERNWAVRKVADAQRVRTLGGEMWLFNPVSGFWYSLRYKKDVFSTLNQGTGVYCFDTWLAYCKKYGVIQHMQFHDEQAGPSNNKKRTTDLLRKAIDKTNEKLKLNVPLDIDVKFGYSYAEIH
jgi:DNA polymerase III epsilon subunit-like protein